MTPSLTAQYGAALVAPPLAVTASFEAIGASAPGLDVSRVHRTTHLASPGACSSCRKSTPSLGAFVLAALDGALGGLFSLGTNV